MRSILLSRGNMSSHLRRLTLLLCSTRCRWVLGTVSRLVLAISRAWLLQCLGAWPLFTALGLARLSAGPWPSRAARLHHAFSLWVLAAVRFDPLGIPVNVSHFRRAALFTWIFRAQHQSWRCVVSSLPFASRFVGVVGPPGLRSVAALASPRLTFGRCCRVASRLITFACISWSRLTGARWFSFSGASVATFALSLVSSLFAPLFLAPSPTSSPSLLRLSMTLPLSSTLA